MAKYTDIFFVGVLCVVLYFIWKMGEGISNWGKDFGEYQKGLGQWWSDIWKPLSGGGGSGGLSGGITWTNPITGPVYIPGVTEIGKTIQDLEDTWNNFNTSMANLPADTSLYENTGNWINDFWGNIANAWFAATHGG
jgi:hypothetical protein